MTWSTLIFRQTVRDAMRPLPPVVPLGTECGEAVKRMASMAAPCALVVDEGGRAVGILTDQDVTRRVAFQIRPGVPVEWVMTRQVPGAAADEQLYQAMSRMRRQNQRLVVVTDSARQPVGLLELDAALTAASAAMLDRLDRLTPEDSAAGLRGVKRAEAEIAGEMLADNTPAPEIQAFLTEINRDLHRRVVERSLVSMRESGWGEPPVALCVLVMGSGGRGENYLDPDQDNGFILGDYPDDSHPAVDRFFVELAERVTRELDAIGFPLCEGGVMATNPSWRKTLPQWRRQIEGWAERLTIGATLQADIFFDFQPVYGDAGLAAGLRRHVFDLPQRRRALLHSMALDHSSQGVALGMFGQLAAEGEDSVNRGRIELKLRGTLPLVGCVRLLALSAGVEDTGTLARIERLAGANVLNRADADALREAYHHVAFLLLRQQVADVRAGRPAGDYVQLAALTEQERELLAGALKSIDRLRKRTHMELGGSTM